MNHPINIYLTCCYNFDGRQRTELHSHKNAYQLFYCISGKTRRICGGREIQLSTGQAMLASPGMPHGMFSCTGEILDIKFAVFDATLAKNLDQIAARQIVCQQADSLFLQIAELTKHPAAYAARLRELHLETAFYTIFTSHPAVEKTAKDFSDRDPILQSQIGGHIERWIVPFIDGYIILPAEKFTIAKISREIGYNSRYLGRQFSNEMGISLTKYYYNRRIAIAKHFLDTTDLPVSDIAAILGYDDVTYFVKYFKKNTGLLPKTYRAQNRTASVKDSEHDQKE